MPKPCRTYSKKRFEVKVSILNICILKMFCCVCTQQGHASRSLARGKGDLQGNRSNIQSKYNLTAKALKKNAAIMKLSFIYQ
jgi:hypothetical protein